MSVNGGDVAPAQPVATLTVDEVSQLLGQRDIAIHQLSKELAKLQVENQRLRADLAEATKDKLSQG